jgi:hypothetical protein
MTPSILIRLSMVLGVLIFGGVTWFLRNSGNAPVAMSPDGARTLLWIGRAAWGIAIAGCIVIFAMLQRDFASPRAQSLSIVAWALGEMVALFGGVVWYVTGRNDWYISGVIFLVLALLAFPGGRSRTVTERA